MTTYFPQQYYTTTAQSGDVEDNEIPLRVNCCGIATISPQSEKRMTLGRRKDYYLMYMISGALQAELGGKAFLLRTGSFICIPPHTPYLYNCASSESVKYFWIHFTGAMAGQVLEMSSLEPLEQYYTKGLSESAELYEKLFSEFRSRTEKFGYRSALILQNILMRLSAGIISDDRKATLDTSIKYIHTHIGEELSVQALAEMEYMSAGYYRALFKKVTGSSPSDYIAEQRINRACQLLAETTQSIDSIAASVGISDRLYFQRFFKKRMGVTPYRYRADSVK